MQFDKDKIITYTIIGVAVIGLLFLTLSSTGQFTGKTDKSFWSAIDNHNFNDKSDFDRDGVSDFDECPELRLIFKDNPSFGDEKSKDDMNKIGGFVVLDGGIAGSPNLDVDCKVGAWSEWSECDIGVKYKTRNINQHPMGGGKACPSLKESEPCEEKAAGSFGEIIRGCTDFDAENYNPAATKDDGTCEYISLPTTPVLRWSAPYEFNVDQCKVTLNNGLYEGQALIIIQISSGSDIKKYSYEPINLVQSQQVVIETTSPNGWDSTYDCEIFLWEDFSGKPISSWKYSPQNVGTLPSNPETIPGDGTINPPIDPVTGGLNPFT